MFPGKNDNMTIEIVVTMFLYGIIPLVIPIALAETALRTGMREIRAPSQSNPLSPKVKIWRLNSWNMKTQRLSMGNP